MDGSHLTFCERPNAARCDIVDPGTRLGYGKENSVPGLLFERRLGLGLMHNSLDGSEGWRAPRQAEVVQVDDAAAPRVIGVVRDNAPLVLDDQVGRGAVLLPLPP